MSKQYLVHPETGEIRFCEVPEMKSRGVIIPAGEVRLQNGRHSGPNRGWGAAHIWAEHAEEMRQRGFHSKEEVPAYVATIVQYGVPLFYEGGFTRNIRVMAVRSSSGTAVLEHRSLQTGSVWSIVTAFSGTRTQGTRVGTLR